MQSKGMESAHWDLPSEPIQGPIWSHMGLDLLAAGQLMIEKKASWDLQGPPSEASAKEGHRQGPPLGRAIWVAVTPQEFSLIVL